MKLDMYAVQDAAVGAYNRPMFFRSRAEAVRSFSDACRSPEAGFSAHAVDYSFWCVGWFDDSTGVVSAIDPERVCGAKDFVLPEIVPSK
ncbi:nonstructural protein [Blackfly microvirus SF02]|uniref:Nonstructural protein n=1 Tax=Blackfly microvirus SF02 TaxID=2576452 RepID=A0A4P8PKN3_9VIRU|nr:nonstructural protein [Blackfly microvirus SF02]